MSRYYVRRHRIQKQQSGQGTRPQAQVASQQAILEGVTSLTVTALESLYISSFDFDSCQAAAFDASDR